MSPFQGQRRNLRRERPERAASPQPRATHWVSAYKRLRPVREKVWANGWFLLLPLQGVGNGDMAPRALPWARDLLGFQPVLGRHNIRPPHFASKVSYSASPQTFATCSRSAYSFRVPLWGGWAAACCCFARDKLFVLWMLAFFVVDVFGLTKGQKKWDTSVSRPC